MNVTITESTIDPAAPIEQTGSALWFSNKATTNSDTIQVFANPNVTEHYDIDLEPSSAVDRSDYTDDAIQIIQHRVHDDNVELQIEWESRPLSWEILDSFARKFPHMVENYAMLHNISYIEPWRSIIKENASTTSSTSSTAIPSIILSLAEEEEEDSSTQISTTTTNQAIIPDNYHHVDPNATIQTELPSRYQTRSQTRRNKNIFEPTSQEHANNTNPSFEIKDAYLIEPIPQEYADHAHAAYIAEVEVPTQDAADMDPNLFLPAPNTWKEIMKLPPHIMKFWKESLLKELKELIKKGTFIHETPKPDDPIIPVTAKFRVKLTQDGTVEKLKSRIALRGDLIRENVYVPNTWCPVAGFRAFKLFLASATYYKQRVYQLDYIAAFLQSDVMGRKFTVLPKEWKEFFKEYPEVQEWIGEPKRLGKSLYGDTVANLAWDTTLSEWLTSNEIGFERLPSEGSIFRRSTKEGLIMLLNATDDQLYFATSPTLKEWFERETKGRFDVQLLGQASWYLQSRITQLADYSIILDQSRYAALIAARYLKPISPTEITTENKTRYASPLPYNARFTKHDCSQTYIEVLKLQEEFGFDYSAAIGSLIYLMNTFVKLNFAIRKLARFMQYPGKTHFKLLKHLLKHIQYHRCSGGIKFYANPKLSPLYQLLADNNLKEYGDYTFLIFTDSSFQDCPDTLRSTGGHLIFLQGAVIDAASAMPALVSNSSCEAEYSYASIATMAGMHTKKIFNEMIGRPTDAPLTIPLGIDSKSAIDTATSFRDTQRTRHISRRYHFVRFAVHNGTIKLFKISGLSNPANSLTKVLPLEQFHRETSIYQVEVDP
jgi:hypothetical protein